MSLLVPQINIDNDPSKSKWENLRRTWLKTNPNQIRNLRRVSYTPSIAHIVAAAFSNRSKTDNVENKDEKEDQEKKTKDALLQNEVSKDIGSRRASFRMPEIPESKPSGDPKRRFTVHLTTRPKTAPSYSSRKDTSDKSSDGTNVLKKDIHNVLEKSLTLKEKKNLSSYEYLHLLLQVLEPQLAESYRPGVIDPRKLSSTPESRARAIAHFRMAQRKISLLKGFLNDCSKISKLRMESPEQRKRSLTDVPE